MNDRLVLFVHGLGGTPRSTWGLFESLLGSDKDLGGLSVGYFTFPTSLFRLPLLSPKYPKVQTLAQALGTQIENSYTHFRDITLVCHSLGGLIGKQYLIDCVDASREMRVKRVLLYAVPNNGAALAGVAGCISWRHNQLRQLCQESDLVRNVSKEWKRTGIEQRIHVRYILGACDKVVNEHSARETWSNPNVDVLVDRGHRDAVKPKHVQDMCYLILKNQMLNSDSKKPPAVPFDGLDTNGPSTASAFDRAQNDAEVRVVVSAVLRIEHAGKYLLIRNTHRPESFAPVGGVYKYRPSARPTLDTFCYRADARDLEMQNDVRGFVTKGTFSSFQAWFKSEAHRETAEECLRRELEEELDEVSLSFSQLADLNFRKVRAVDEGPEFVEAHKYWQFRIFEIYEFTETPSAHALLDILKQSSKTSKDLLWVTADEIQKGRAQTREVLAPHASYFLGTKRYRGLDPAF
jgi:ADP-ribose pyrophosphatase YjhB (NUDIX family)